MNARMSAPGAASQRRALLVPSFAGGGAERVMVTFANELGALGLSVDLVVGSATGPYRSEVAPSVRICELGYARMSHGLFALATYLRRERPAWLVSTMFQANVVAVLAKRLAASPTRVWVREATTPSEALRLHSRGTRWLFHAAWQLYGGADGILAPTEGVAEDLRELLGRGAQNELRVLANPISLDAIRTRAAEDLPPSLAQMPKPWLVVCGRLAAPKDFETPLRALAELGRAQPARTPSLIILGEGPDRPRLERLTHSLGIAERCHFAGFVANPFAVFARAAVFVMSSQHEGFPNGLLQAMACGTRVVATDCRSGPREILRNEAEGLLVPIGDPSAMAAAILRQLDAPGDTHAVQRRAEDFAAPAVTRRLLDLCEARAGEEREC
ncbi:MAG TPA: glycosyltransferase [Polyangiaceae bacterium]|nr:glycosyltransferase [Polyangiaceae bacterium]